jgi:ATP-dependent DNA helicase RecG
VFVSRNKNFYSVFNEGDVFAISQNQINLNTGLLQFIHPDFDRITEEEEKSFFHTGKLFLSTGSQKN